MFYTQTEFRDSLFYDVSAWTFPLAFNVNYLQEILSTINSDKIEINFFGSDKSCLITNPSSNDLKYVVMPLLI